MRTMTIKEFQDCIKSQGQEKIEDVEFICPRCKTKQTARDLINAGAGKDMNEVEKYLAFSCVGRFTKDKGCDWTLGGLFKIHELEVMHEGEGHPRFLPVGFEAFGSVSE